MLGAGGTLPLGAGDGGSGGSSSYVGRDIVWVDLRVAGGTGNNGTEAAPFNTANIGLTAVPDGGTLVLVGGDASVEPGVTISARSFSVRGLSGQMTGGGLTPVLPTLTYAITSGAQRLAFHNVTVTLVHSGAAAGLTKFHFEFCPAVTLTAGSSADDVYATGDRTCTFSGAGGAGNFRGLNLAGYVANGSNAIVASDCNVTGALTSSTTITLIGACTFSAVSITAPTILLDDASYKNAVTAGVSFSSTAQVLIVYGTPVDIGTANAAGTSQAVAHADHVHNLPFPSVNSALGNANATINVNNQRITGVAAPTSSTDVVNKSYADAIATGLKVKTPAVAVATSNQATLTGTAQTIDGVALNTNGMRVLLTAQTTATQNGLWVVGTPWTRPTDFATGSSAAQSYVLVTGGTANGGSSYYDNNTAGTDVVDTNNLTWVLFAQASTVTAGAGLTKTGNTIDVVAADATIAVAADSIAVGTIGNANLADNTIALGRLANAGAQNDFLMRKSSGAGAWEDATLAQAQSALGITASGALKAVRAATTGNITLSGTQTVDGVALVAGDRCLVKDQATGSQNGVYIVAAGAWSRATDAATTGQLFAGIVVPIGPEGTANPKRVAMLTTADPITIGSTALTFQLDRVIPAASVAPANVTNGAAVLGTSPDGARADHAHSLTFATWVAIAAAATGAISVNSQKITNLATPTVSTDAATKGYVDGLTTGFVAPTNPGDNGKLAYANAGALAYATAIKTNGTYLQFGTTFTAGLTNFAHGANAVFGVNKATTFGVPLVRWGVFIDDLLYIGSTVSDSGKVANMRYGVHTGGAFTWEINGGAEYSADASQLDVHGNNVVGAGYIASTGTVAGSGFLRTSANATIVVAHSNIGAGDVVALSVDSADHVVLGSTTSVRNYYNVATGGAHIFQVNGTDACSVSASVFDFKSLVASFGAAPASAGVVRFSGNTAQKWRNLGGTPNTFDVQGIAVDASDNVIVGDNTNGTALYLDAKSGGSVNVRVGTSIYTFGPSLLAMNALGMSFTSANAGSAAPSTAGLQRYTGSPGVILGARNYDNSGDVTVLKLEGDGATFSDLRLGDGTTKGNNALYLESHGFVELRIAGGPEYDFFTTYANWNDNQLRFGSNPSTNALINATYSASSTAIIASKDSGGTARNIVSFTNTNQAQFGSGLIDTQIAAQGNFWNFSTTASFPGVGHNIAAGGFLSFGTAATTGTIRGGSTFTIYGTNGASTNIGIIGLAGSVVGVGDSASSSLVVASGGAVSIRPNGSFTDSYAFSTTTADFKTSALKIDNVSSVPSAPGSGGYLYASGGELWWISSSGRKTAMGFA